MPNRQTSDRDRIGNFYSAPQHMPLIRILDCEMQSLSMHEAISDLDNIIQNGQKTQVSYLNADCLNKAFSDNEYLNVIKKSGRVFPDGIGVKIACKITSQIFCENINGTDMFPEICKLSQAKNYRIFLLGAKPGVVDKMIERLHMRFPRLQISGIHHGYFHESETGNIIEKINSSSTDILFVAMGAPRQEKWIHRNFDFLKCSVMLGVGGLFDFNSESIQRAPLWMRKIGLEWTWRLIQEPKRMWRRYLIGNFIFIYRVFRYKKKLPSTE